MEYKPGDKIIYYLVQGAWSTIKKEGVVVDVRPDKIKCQFPDKKRSSWIHRENIKKADADYTRKNNRNAYTRISMVETGVLYED
jgi:hypothetical protein